MEERELEDMENVKTESEDVENNAMNAEIVKHREGVKVVRWKNKWCIYQKVSNGKLERLLETPLSA